ncbi:carboxypeptidase-like regulatory domain-containing protein [Bernardetia sp. OM2101]|uniref:TonB-dependent receptor n=1 Tax=Bernardetia sp. OM2101 TaxID=3344876 RepID=UPI0035D01803
MTYLFSISKMAQYALPQILFFLFIFLFLTQTTQAQTLTQSISGKVLEEGTGQPVPFANVIVLDIEPLMGVTTDSAGNFKIKNMPIGRHTLQVSYVSYQTRQIEVVVNSLNETVVEMRLKDDSFELKGVVITAQEEHGTPKNVMVLSGGRTLSMEEARRYAGGFDDPARLASSFAGVGGSLGNNGVIVRGNAPKGMLWRMEGVEIPNPNHFADIIAFGGGGLTALSSHLLANSDFLLSAFPAEYGNALSGVFDIKIRNGKTDKRSHAFQVGALGIDVASEGAFKKGKESSYIFNYRYSMLGLIQPLLPENAGGTNYQDLSFKMNFPTQKAGTFSIWGISALDNSGQLAEKDSTKRQYEANFEEANSKQYMGAVGINHRIHLGKVAYLNTNFTSSGNGIDVQTNRLNENEALQPSNEIKNNLIKHTFSSYLNTQLGKKHINRTGIIANFWQYDVTVKQKQESNNLETLVQSKDNALHFQGYTQSLIDVSSNFTINLGSHFQYLAINEKFSIEPRFSFEYRLPKKQTLTFGYGLHSRIEPIYIYLVKNRNIGNSEPLNKDLDLTKAHHFTLGYQKMLSSTLRLKVETYYQELFNVPVIADSSFSLLNLSQSWFIDKKLINEGKGRNYGLDITVEKFLDKGFFYLFTLSLFNSTYQGGDKIWHNTRFNQQFITNALVGKEWQVGKDNNNVMALSVRLTYQGGERISPIDYTASANQKEVVFDDNRAFENQNPHAFLAHLSLNYQKNKPKHRSIWSLQVLNALAAKEFYGYRYNFRTGSIDAHKESLVIPNIAYKIEF